MLKIKYSKKFVFATVLMCGALAACAVTWILPEDSPPAAPAVVADAPRTTPAPPAVVEEPAPAPTIEVEQETAISKAATSVEMSAPLSDAERALYLSMSPSPPAVEITTEAERKRGVTRFKLLRPEEIEEPADPPDDAFFMFTGRSGTSGGRRGMQGAISQDKLGVHEDVMKLHADLRPAFDVISKDNEARLDKLTGANSLPPVPGGHWRVLVKSVEAAPDGAGRLIHVFASRGGYVGSGYQSDGGLTEVWSVSDSSQTPRLRSRVHTGVPGVVF